MHQKCRGNLYFFLVIWCVLTIFVDRISILKYKRMFIICERNNFSLPLFLFSGFAKHEPTNLLGHSRNYYWLVMPIKELKIILSHDFNAAALPNMDQSTSSDSSATFTDQNSMYPRNDFPMQEWNIIPGPSAASTNSDIRISQNIAAAGTCRSKWVYIFHYKQRCMSYD